jgi:CBS domain-containing protein
MSHDLLQLRARDAMHSQVQWTCAQENLRAAGERMSKHGIRALLVSGEHASDLPGIVTSKDIVNLLGSQDAAVLDQLRVGDVMTRPAICVPAQTNLRDCINLMRLSGVRRMPVLDGTTVVGVLSTSDIFARALQPA